MSYKTDDGRSLLAAQPQGYMPPLRVNQMKIVVLHIRPLAAMLHFDDLVLGVALDLPHRRRSIPGDDQKQPPKLQVFRQCSSANSCLRWPASASITGT